MESGVCYTGAPPEGAFPLNASLSLGLNFCPQKMPSPWLLRPGNVTKRGRGVLGLQAPGKSA